MGPPRLQVVVPVEGVYPAVHIGVHTTPWLAWAPEHPVPIHPALCSGEPSPHELGPQENVPLSVPSEQLSLPATGKTWYPALQLGVQLAPDHMLPLTQSPFAFAMPTSLEHVAQVLSVKIVAGTGFTTLVHS